MREEVSQSLAKAFSLLLEDVTIEIDYKKLARETVKAIIEEREKERKNPRVVITQRQAIERYGRHVIMPLVKRGFLHPYKFDYRECTDEDGVTITKTKGLTYYRVADIEEAIENGNVYNFKKRGL